MIRVGVDLGGTKIEVIALDHAGAELLRRRIATPRNDYDAILGAIAALVGNVERELDTPASVGVGMPGSLSRATGLLRGANTQCLNGKPIAHDLASRLGREVAVANDANCFALSEAVDGAGAGADVVFGVILGTGVGGGIVVRGEIWSGPNGIAGEWGHNPLPWPNPDEMAREPCFCTRRACIETFLSGPGLERDVLHATGEALTTHAIVSRARAGDAACMAALARYQERLARALAHIVNVLDPDVIVLGGGMSGIASIADVERQWTQWIFSDRVDTRLVLHRHGDSSGVRGAAWLGGVRR
jgi:fructokinase